MRELYSFSLSGSGKTDLNMCLDFILTHTDGIEAFSYEEMEKPDRPTCLVFHSYETKDSQKYGFPVNSVILAEQITQWLDALDELELRKFGARPNGSEESYEMGWELFSPDWYSIQHGIANYELSMVLAIKPKLLEWGK